MATLKSIGGNFYICEYYRDEYGKRKTKYYPTRTPDRDEAEILLEEYHATGLSPVDNPRAGINTVEAVRLFVEAQREHNKASTADNYETLLPALLNRCRVMGKPVAALVEEDLHPALKRRGIKPVTIQNYKRHLKAFWSWMVRKKIVPRNIVADITVPKAQQPDYNSKMMTPDEFEKFQAMCRKDQTRKWLGPYVAVLYYAGLRKTEALQLQVADILDDFILVGGATKSYKNRYVPIVDELRVILAPYMKGLDPDGPLWVNAQGNPVGPDYAASAFKDKLKLAKIPKTRTLHGMRHGAVTRWLQSGTLTVGEAKDVAGHSSIGVTMVYTHIAPAHLLEKMRKK